MNYCVPLDSGDFSRVYITDFGEPCQWCTLSHDSQDPSSQDPTLFHSCSASQPCDLKESLCFTHIAVCRPHTKGKHSRILTQMFCFCPEHCFQTSSPGFWLLMHQNAHKQQTNVSNLFWGAMSAMPALCLDVVKGVVLVVTRHINGCLHCTFLASLNL